MRKRKSKNYLVIGTVHLGYSHQLLQLFAKAAEYYKAEVIHIGPLCSEKEMRESSKRLSKVEEYENLGKDMDDRMRRTMVRLKKESDFWTSNQEERMGALIKHFKKVTFVVNEESFNDSTKKPAGAKFVYNYMELGPHLKLSSSMPSGDKTTGSPITKRSLLKYRQHGKSWIVPHPLSAIESHVRVGLNQAYNYITTGSLDFQKDPNSTKMFYQLAQDPSAIFVSIDEELGHFHAKPLHVDSFRGEVSHRLEPMILDDGLLISCDSVRELPSSDKASWSTDDHADYEHMGVLGATRALNKLNKPRTFINGGDASDFSSVNRHAKGQPGSVEGLRVVHDLNNLQRLLKAQGEEPSIQERVLLDSNHHEWLTIFVKENPNLKGILDWKTVQKERFPDWNILIRDAGEDKVYWFGDYACRHGDHEANAKAGSEIFQKYIGGHYHRYHSFRRAFSSGPGCRLGPSYLQNKLTAWQNQIGSLTKYKGKAAVSLKTVLHNEKTKKSYFLFRHEIIEVDFHKYK